MIKNKELFSALDEGFLADVCNANSSRSKIIGRGTVQCLMKDHTGRSCVLGLSDAFWKPSYARNLVSVKRLTDKGALIQFNQDAHWNGCAKDDKRRTFQCEGLTCGDGVTGNDVSLYQALASSDGAQQLARCGKIAARSRGHEGMNIAGSEKRTNCNICCTEKENRPSTPKTWGTRAKTKLAIVHTDVLGPIQQEFHEGFRYAVGFIDSNSCFGTVHLMKSKDEITAKLQRFIMVSDGALEFKSKQFSDLCRSNGIKQEFSAPYTPEENGKIERACSTVTGMSRCMMATAGVQKQFWLFALSTAIYLKSRSIHSAHGKAPFQII